GILVGLTGAASAQVLEATGTWQDPTDGVRFSFVLHVQFEGEQANGEIDWTLLSAGRNQMMAGRAGASAKEYVRGTKDVSGREQLLEGYKVSDDTLIGVDEYRIPLTTSQFRCFTRGNHEWTTVLEGTWQAAPATTPDATVPPERIAFVRDSGGGNEDIYVIDADGTNLKRLTTDPAVDWHPSWAPDGRRLAFSSKRDGRSSIYIMADDGTGVARLTSGQGSDYEPAWSPDGNTIVFRRAIGDDEEADNDLWCISSDGTGLRQLTSGHWCDVDPAWSHDGARIIFARAYDGGATHSGLQVINPDSTGLRAVALPSEDSCDEPAFSPDGEYLAYRRLSTSSGITLRHLRGSKLQPIIGTESFQRPAWSPDGKCFVCDNGYGDSQLFVVQVQNLEVKPMHVSGREAAWSRASSAPDPASSASAHR
ncbi:MAG: hypothetical protein ABFE07_13215, partial [Armatimonadia bacterium]